MSQKSSRDIKKYYDKLKLLNKPILDPIKKGNLNLIGNLFNKHWELKKNLSKKITDKKINNFRMNYIQNIIFWEEN